MVMAVSAPKPDATTSSISSTPHEPHEQTPLLESHSDIRTANSFTEPRSSQQWRPGDSTVASEDDKSVSEIDSGKKDRKVETDMVGVISVLLLGMLYSARTIIFS